MLRIATPDDASAIASIYNASVAARDSTMQLAPVAVDAVTAWIRPGEREVTVVVEEEGRVMGYGRLMRYSPRGGYRHAAETSVYVRREATGRGIGTRIQAALLDRAAGFRDHHLVAKIWAGNAASRALHDRFGYTEVGIQREIGRVNGCWEDVAILQKTLPTPPPDRLSIREATVVDVPDLARIYTNAARTAGPRRYTPAQVEAWTAFAGTPDFRDFIQQPDTLVATTSSGPVGFTGLRSDGHVTALYVRGDWQGRRIASVLLQSILDHARGAGLSRLTTDANPLSRPLFSRFGFQVEEVETVERRGEVFERDRMGRDVGER